jgi:hypothetical protein
MLAKWLGLGIVFLPGCGFLPIFKHIPLQIKAMVEGEIKGYKIHCEKMINVADGKWGVMCSLGNGLDVKYRISPTTSSEQTHMEFVVGKAKEGREKIIATPALVVKKTQSVHTTTTTPKSSIMVKAERVQ